MFAYDYSACRKGFVYTLFAFFAIMSLVAVIGLSGNMGDERMDLSIDEKLRADEVSYLSDGIEQDYGRSSYISARRATIALMNELMESGNYTSGQSDMILKDIIYSGRSGNTTFEMMEGSSVDDWKESIRDLGDMHRFNISLHIHDQSLNSSGGFFLVLKDKADIYIHDLLFGISLNDSFSASRELEISMVEDPLVSIESYGSLRRNIIPCNRTLYPYNVRMISEMGDFGYASPENWTGGRMTTDIDEPAPSSRILVVENIPDMTNDAHLFRGVISANSSDDTSGRDNWILGAQNISELEGLVHEPIIVMSEGKVFSSYIYDEFNSSCYFKDPFGPSFLDRAEGNMMTTSRYNRSGQVVGIASFVDLASLPENLQHPYSSVDFKYFMKSEGYGIKGVTEIYPGEYLAEHFRLDDDHIGLWDIEDLRI